jgi:hypothetical protein
VCERKGRWAAALRRQAEGPQLRLEETRSLAGCWQALAGHPGSFLVLEATPENLDAVLGRLAQLGHDDPAARAAVVAGRRLAGLEWLFREAGAVWFTVSPREVAALASIARRHLELAPEPPRTLAQQVWAMLPWGHP